ncbi:hypothetical protein B9Z19DRAFT_1098137 [Tuber borchii]|uniref:BZIP domain-containing protein n=1 Tax=Tuber borchii TaxID=42251 RepID=A0A2T7A9D4_TUBBO|nr:hypothetical protein B9Z19DRAFT_1098137 [Tuber borchii]
MASAFHYPMDHYIQQNSLSLDTRRQQQQWLDDDESSVLDDNILDNNLLDSALDMSPIDRRRPSLLETNAIFSPSNDWDFEDHDMDLSAGPADDNSPVPAATFEHSNGTNNPFIKLEQAQPAFAQQNGSWSSNHGASGSCTPTVYDNNAFSNTAFEDGSAYLAPAIGGAGPAGAFGSDVHITPHATVFQGAGAVSSIPSTPAQKDWAQASGAEGHDSQPLQKRMRQQSPGPRAHSPLHVMRRDGIRKKNARFDIPAERTLMNIDQLIARSQDDNEIKELKQQKRLLRNRQAALDSRQRKKQHTERLEEEKKIHSAVIQDLEDKLNAMSMQEEQMHQRIENLIRERDFLAHKAETLQMEKEDIVREHTIETRELRKKNAFAESQVQKMQEALDRASMAHAPSSSGFSDTFNLDSDFDLGTEYWDGPMSMPSSDIAPIKSEKIQPRDAEKPAAAPGLLLILLLCGAFVASSKTSVPSLPPIPKQLQSASADVLNNIFQDAGVAPIEAGRVEAADVSPTSDTWMVAKSSVSQMVGLDSSVAMLNARLEKPTAEQQHESFMQLTAAEYNDVTSNNFLRDPEPAARNRRHLEEGLASMRNKPTAADVYTRSLLWDKVDAEVVRRFAAFAQRAQSQQAQQASSNDCEAGGYGDSAV